MLNGCYCMSVFLPSSFTQFNVQHIKIRSKFVDFNSTLYGTNSMLYDKKYKQNLISNLTFQDNLIFAHKCQSKRS